LKQCRNGMSRCGSVHSGGRSSTSSLHRPRTTDAFGSRRQAQSLPRPASTPALTPAQLERVDPELHGLLSLDLNKLGRRPSLVRRTADQQRLLYEMRECDWLSRRGRKRFVPFSDPEKEELRSYFTSMDEAAATDGGENVDHVEGYLTSDELGEVLISLGLSDTLEDVHKFLSAVDGGGTGLLDFREYLASIRIGEKNSAIFQVFKAMMDGKLGDRNLQFPNVVSTYRRKMFMESMFSKDSKVANDEGSRADSQQNRGARILQNFAAMKDSQQNRGARILQNFAAMKDSQQNRGARILQNFAAMKGIHYDETPGRNVPLELAWRQICQEKDIVGDDTVKTIHAPESPRKVIQEVLGHKRRTRSRPRKVVRNDDSFDAPVASFTFHGQGGKPYCKPMRLRAQSHRPTKVV